MRLPKFRDRDASLRGGDPADVLREEPSGDWDSRRRRRRPPRPAEGGAGGIDVLDGCSTWGSTAMLTEYDSARFTGGVFFDMNRRFNDDEVHGRRDLSRARAPGREPERGVILTLQSITMKPTDPAPLIKEMLRRLQLPNMRRNTTDLNVDEFGSVKDEAFLSRLQRLQWSVT